MHMKREGLYLEAHGRETVNIHGFNEDGKLLEAQLILDNPTHPHSNKTLLDEYDARQWFDVKPVTSSPYNITPDDDLLVVNCSLGGGAIEINLPAATGSGKVYRIKDIGTDNADVTPNATDTIDGVNAPVTLTQWDGIQVVDHAAGAWIEI